jgi:PQQ enzyme repeat
VTPNPKTFPHLFNTLQPSSSESSIPFRYAEGCNDACPRNLVSPPEPAPVNLLDASRQDGSLTPIGFVVQKFAHSVRKAEQKLAKRRHSGRATFPGRRLTAVNAAPENSRGRCLWALRSNYRLAKQNTGRAGGFADPLATAAGVVFTGSTDDNRFRAMDSKTGKELWVTKLPAQGQANPMIYQAKNGKQYGAIVSGGTLNVFVLP